MEILEKILGSAARVKIMRLFLLNRSKAFSSKDVANRSRVSSTIVRKEIKLLHTVGFLKKRPNDWIFNPAFKYGEEFNDLLVRSDSLKNETIMENFKKIGKMKLVITSGIFIKRDDSRVDLLIVGDKIKRGKLEEGIHKLEAELGTELSYAVFDTKEFIYRLNMYDKLVRDVLDYPHEVLMQAKDMAELSTQFLKKA